MGKQIAIAGGSRPAGEGLRVTARPRVGDAVVRAVLVGCGVFVVATTVAMLGFLARTGIRGVLEVGFWGLLTGDVWKPEAGSYGGLALIVGTFASALGAIALGAAPAVLTAVWLTEFAGGWMRSAHRRVMEIASAIPSVVYGWLALVYLVPQMQRLARAIRGPDEPVTGAGLAARAALLAVMIAPPAGFLSLDAVSRGPRAPR